MSEPKALIYIHTKMLSDSPTSVHQNHGLSQILKHNTLAIPRPKGILNQIPEILGITSGDLEDVMVDG